SDTTTWNLGRFIYSQLIAGISLLAIFTTLLPSVDAFVQIPIDIALSLLWWGVFGLLFNFTEYPCGWVFEWMNIAPPFEPQCVKFDANAPNNQRANLGLERKRFDMGVEPRIVNACYAPIEPVPLIQPDSQLNARRAGLCATVEDADDESDLPHPVRGDLKEADRSTVEAVAQGVLWAMSMIPKHTLSDSLHSGTVGFLEVATNRMRKIGLIVGVLNSSTKPSSPGVQLTVGLDEGNRLNRCIAGIHNAGLLGVDDRI
ncbi:hypothetical protein E4U58_001397, partial [Claviceps cyperi]